MYFDDSALSDDSGFSDDSAMPNKFVSVAKVIMQLSLTA